MAREINAELLDTKIEKAQQDLVKAKHRYDAATATAKKTPVEDGLIDSDKIQIVSGLSYDDKVITSWSKELYDGAAVNIQGSDDSAETTADSSETTAEETTEAAETAAK